MKKKTVTLLVVLAASLSFAALGAEATHPAPGEEMYEASASTTVKAPAPAPNRRPDEGLGPYKRLVVRGATLIDGTGMYVADRIGSVEANKTADLVIVSENPLANFKVLYGTGAQRLNDATGKVERVGGVRWTIHDGIIYDAKKLLADVRTMVSDAKAKEAAQAGAAH
jgi:hypothetical protein